MTTPRLFSTVTATSCPKPDPEPVNPPSQRAVPPRVLLSQDTDHAVYLRRPIKYLTTAGPYERPPNFIFRQQSLFNCSAVNVWHRDENQRRRQAYLFYDKHVIEVRKILKTVKKALLPGSKVSEIPSEKDIDSAPLDQCINLLCQVDLGFAWAKYIRDKHSNRVFQREIRKDVNTFILAATNAEISTDVKKKLTVAAFPFYTWTYLYPTVELTFFDASDFRTAEWESSNGTKLQEPGNLLNGDIIHGTTNPLSGDFGYFRVQYIGLRHALIAVDHEWNPLHFESPCSGNHQAGQVLGPQKVLATAACAGVPEAKRRSKYDRQRGFFLRWIRDNGSQGYVNPPPQDPRLQYAARSTDPNSSTAENNGAGPFKRLTKFLKFWKKH